MEPETRQGLEAMLFLADDPLGVDELAEVLEVEEADVEEEVTLLAQRYRDEQRGIEIRRAAGGWRMYSAEAARPLLERWALAGRTGRLTQAALETLAVIAYKQPISRQDIGDIRGVNADGAVRSLVARGLVEDAGRDEGPGQAVLYRTTDRFLERIGVDSLEELPPLTEFLPESPAPDEPELGAIREARRRLAEAGGPTRTEGEQSTDATGDDALPPPAARERESGQEMDDLTDRLDQAARSAVDRLRQAVTATERTESDGDEDPEGAASVSRERPDEAGRARRGPDPEGSSDG